MSILPKSLQYKQIKPNGFASSFKRWRVQPQTTHKTYSNDEVIRFHFQTDDFIDPYQSYLEVIVQFDPEDYLQYNFFDTLKMDTRPTFHLDGPSTSLFKEMVLYSNNKEIERLQEYDQVGNMLSDFGMKLDCRAFKQFEGYSYEQPMSSNTFSIAQSIGQFSGNGTQVSSDVTYQHYNNTQGLPITDRRHIVKPGPLSTSLTVQNAHNLQNIQSRPQNSFKSPLGILPIFDLGPSRVNFPNNNYPFVDGRNFTKDYFQVSAGIHLMTKGLFLYGVTDQQCGDVNSSVFNYGSNTHRNVFTDQLITTGNDYNGVLSNYNGQTSGVDNPTRNNRANVYRNCPRVNFAQQQIVNNSQFGIQGNGSYQSSIYGNIDITTFELNAHPTYEFQDLDFSVLPPYEALVDGAYYQSKKAGQTSGYIRPLGVGSSFNKTAVISPFIPHVQIVNGKFVTGAYALGYQYKTMSEDIQLYTTSARKFYVPILSGVIGQLIPQDEWKLIPGMGLGDMMFEWRVNPYAFFASGHSLSANDIPIQLDDKYTTRNSAIGIKDRDVKQYTYKLKWKILDISMNFDLWRFNVDITQQIRSMLQGDGIKLTSQGFSIGPKYQITNTQGVKNNWHINNGIISLRGIYFYFLSDDYLTYSFCRKNYKLSHNLRSMQLKIGTEWLPQDPISGNAGNISLSKSDFRDASPFYIELQRCVGGFFDCGKTFNIALDQFVLNDRPYNPESVEDTHSQLPLFHEERCRGQAIYGFDLLSDPTDNTVLSGINTTQARPIELVLDVNAGGDFNRQSTMYIFLHHDVLVDYRFKATDTVGRG